MPSSMDVEFRFDIGSTFGIAYIGAMIAMGLYGITTLQSYLYYMYYPEDKLSLKLLVAALWFLETLQVAFVCHAMYSYLILNFANPVALETSTWSFVASVLCNLVISTIVQLFFAARVHALSSNRWWLTILIMISILAHLAFGLETVIDAFILKNLINLSSIALVAVLPFSITAVFPDVLIASSLCYFLSNGKNPGFRGTNALLTRLMIYAINRCLLTSIVAIVEVVSFRALPNTLYFLAADFCIGKLYANSLLSTLNTRQVLRGIGYESESLPFSESNPIRSSRLMPTPQFGLRPNAHRNDTLDLTDLRATWPSEAGTHESTDSVLGTQSELQSSHRSMDKDEIGNIVPMERHLGGSYTGIEVGERESDPS